MSYLAKLSRALANNDCRPAIVGSLLVVEKLDNETKSKTGIALGVSSEVNGIAKTSFHKVRVLAVGEGYYDSKTGQTTPLDTKPGDIIFTQDFQVRWLPSFPGLGYTGDTVGLMDESATQIRFRGEEALKRFEEECSGRDSG